MAESHEQQEQKYTLTSSGSFWWKFLGVKFAWWKCLGASLGEFSRVKCLGRVSSGGGKPFRGFHGGMSGERTVRDGCLYPMQEYNTLRVTVTV